MCDAGSSKKTASRRTLRQRKRDTVGGVTIRMHPASPSSGSGVLGGASAGRGRERRRLGFGRKAVDGRDLPEGARVALGGEGGVAGVFGAGRRDGRGARAWRSDGRSFFFKQKTAYEIQV